MKPVLVTTSHRGVFFGQLDTDTQNEADKTLTLTNCRNVIKWTGTHGFLGLAHHGPEEGSRIGSPAPRVLLHDITSVTDCTEEATERFASWPE